VAHDREQTRVQDHEQAHEQEYEHDREGGASSGSTDQQGHESQVSPVRSLIENATERIRADLAIGESTELEVYLGVVAAFPSFSLYNQHLVYAQRPTATLFGPFEAWNDMAIASIAEAAQSGCWTGKRRLRSLTHRKRERARRRSRFRSFGPR
jgi:hypothetical protein